MRMVVSMLCRLVIFLGGISSGVPPRSSWGRAYGLQPYLLCDGGSIPVDDKVVYCQSAYVRTRTRRVAPGMEAGFGGRRLDLVDMAYRGLRSTVSK